MGTLTPRLCAAWINRVRAYCGATCDSLEPSKKPGRVIHERPQKAVHHAADAAARNVGGTVAAAASCVARPASHCAGASFSTRTQRCTTKAGAGAADESAVPPVLRTSGAPLPSAPAPPNAPTPNTRPSSGEAGRGEGSAGASPCWFTLKAKRSGSPQATQFSWRMAMEPGGAPRSSGPATSGLYED